MAIKPSTHPPPYPRLDWNGHVCLHDPATSRDARIDLFACLDKLPQAVRRRLRRARHQRKPLSTAVELPDTTYPFACTNCPRSIRLETGDGLSFRAIDPCPFPAGHTYEVALDVPSGKMAWVEGLEALVPHAATRHFDSRHPAWARRRFAEKLARDGVAAFENRVEERSWLRRREDGSYAVQSDPGSPADESFPVMPGTQRVFDHDDLRRRLERLEPDAVRPVHPVRVLAVRPGRYRFTNFYDTLPRGEPGHPEILLRIIRLGDIR